MDSIQTPRELGALIRRTRQAQGLRQNDLAGACGTSIRFLSELERGKATAQVGRVLHVLRMLGLCLKVDEVGRS
jgi:y4mF family transcriptional regulator